MSSIAFYLAFVSAVVILVNLTASEALLAASLAALLVSRAKLRVPRIWLPLTLFVAGSVLSLIFSPEPQHGFVQLKKILVYSVLLVIFSTIRDAAVARRLFQWWSVVAAAIALLGIGQFVQRWRQAHLLHVDFYQFYVTDRVTGTMRHWMTFAGQEMLVLLMLASLVLFARMERRSVWMWSACAALLGFVLVLNETRTVWLGTALGGFWLLWWWRRWVALAGPAALVLLVWIVPGPIHERFVSIFHPQKDIDSNEFRSIARRTGLRMIEAHPLLGIGLDETKYHFLDYLPPDTPRPLPSGFYQHLHNFYLQFAAERGIPTMLMMIWMLVMIVYDFFRALQKLPPGPGDARFLLHGGIAGVIGIMASGLFEVNLNDSAVLAVFLIVVACGYVAASPE
ncbi:MAG TPA: O-antigen ligase family protein [Bryobacteraceae bacterium]|nr:O-antigen ligase family protein [Bryobacteraceae bacterium]